MSIDLYPKRFIQELNKLPTFVNPGIWNGAIQRYRLPAWKAPFMEAVARCHSAYRLPTFKEFSDAFQHALYVHRDAVTHERELYDLGMPSPGLLHRMGQLYEGGIAELYVYSHLVHAFEDVIADEFGGSPGIVLYDMRVDWKLKIDILISALGNQAIVDLYHAVPDVDRKAIEKSRSYNEGQTKVNMQFVTTGNAEVARINHFALVRTDEDREIVNGYSLFSQMAIDRLLADLYDHFGIHKVRPTAAYLLKN